ncbi:MAG: S-layer homology domain-containing protein, partial [Firmicutes bacterium]|nr:S-layer homology domain-containing protein [Bacillota bacterium]
LTELKANDVINAYFYRDTTYYSDLYAYFEDDTVDMTVGKSGSFSVNGLAGGITVVAPKGAAVNVYDADGETVTTMATSVADDGSFNLNFAAAGTYTVEVGGTASYIGSAWDYATNSYIEKEFTDVPVVPAFCTVTVAEAESGGTTGGSGSSGDTKEGITVSFSLITHNATWISAHNIKLDAGATVADAFYKVLDNKSGFSYEADPDYVRSITYKGTTLAEFTEGPNSGWKYRINGVAPGIGMDGKTLNDGDKLVWYYVVDYTDDTDRDEGGSVTITTEDRAAANEVKNLIAAIGKVDENSAEAIKAARAAYEALTDAQKELVSNLDVLKEAEKAYAELTGETITPAESNFVDVKDHWAADAIQYVADKGLMTGVTENTFAPEQATSRAMITTILYRLAGSPAVEGNAAFADIANGTWYSDAIRWAEMNKIVGGYADGSFGPNDNITREQLAVMLWRYAGNPIAAENTLAFNDANGVSDYAKEAMQWANAEGLITGKTGNVIDAKGKATRAEVATILMRYLENTAK